MGTLVLLALARLFVAPEPSPAPTDAPTTTAPSETTQDAGPPLLLIDFRRRTAPQGDPQTTYDLRNPFRASTVQASLPPTSADANTTADPHRRHRASARRHDLRDPFAEPPRKRRAPKPAEDLRDPFTRPTPALPKCPDTGGVPIQRPDSVRAGCAQASRRVVLAHR